MFYSETQYRLTATYMRLLVFEIKGEISENCSTAFCAPNLSELALDLRYPRGYSLVTSCKGIPFSSIRRLHIEWVPWKIDLNEMIQLPRRDPSNP
jgi:hypothetical protein